jgi:hypothetical protein
VHVCVALRAIHEAGVRTPNGEHHCIAVEPEWDEVGRLAFRRDRTPARRALTARYTTTTRARDDGRGAVEEDAPIHCHRTNATRPPDLRHTQTAHQLCLFNRIDGVADETVDVGRREPRVAQCRDDCLRRELGLASAGGLRELSLPDTDDRAPVGCSRVHAESLRGAKTGMNVLFAAASNLTCTGNPIRTSAASRRTRFDTMRTPSSIDGAPR